MTDLAVLPDAELRDLVSQVVGPDTTEPMGAYLFAHDEPGAELARTVERSVFCEAFGNTPDLLDEEYGAYESNSIFFCVIDHLRRVPAGMARIILPSPYGPGLKSLNDIESQWGVPVKTLLRQNNLPLPVDRTWDWATLAVGPAYQGAAAAGLVSMGLYQAMTMSAVHCQVDWMVAIMDHPVFRMLQKVLHRGFTAFDGLPPRPYLGSTASLPIWLRGTDLRRRLIDKDPTLGDLIFEGIGLEPALRRVDPDHPRLAAWVAGEHWSGGTAHPEGRSSQLVTASY